MYRTSEDFRKLFSLLPRTDDGHPITLPNTVLDTISPVVDVRDWSPYRDTGRDEQGSNLALIELAFTQVPDGFFRLYLEFSFRVIRAVAAQNHMWLEYQPAGSANRYAVTDPHEQRAGGFTENLVAGKRNLLLGPRDVLVGRVEPTTVAGDTAAVAARFIDLAEADLIAIPKT